jgi:hypothetical protein
MDTNCLYWDGGLFGADDGGRLCSRAEISYANPAVRVTAFGLGVKDLHLGFRACKAAAETVILVLFAVEKHIHIDITPQTQRTSEV